MNFSDKVKNVRATLGFTQEELATQLGVAFATINRWEGGGVNPANSTMSIFNDFCKKNNIYFEDMDGSSSMGVSLITAQQIQSWFCEHAYIGRSILPELVRRLIKESIKSRINKIVFPSADKINISGFDGELDVEIGNQFVPEGYSYWEIGATLNRAAGKFQEDYQKRTDEIPIAERGQHTFVFVTPTTMNAAGKKSLLDKTKKDNWKCVKIIDSIILEEWLSVCLQTSLWLIEKFTNKKLSVQTLENGHNSFMQRTQPSLVDNFFLYAREREKENFLSLLQEKPVIKIGSASKDESYGFVLSSLNSDFKKYEQKCIICNNMETLQNLDSLVSNYIFILNSYVENYDLSLRNKYIFVYGQSFIGNANVDIELDVRSFDDLSQVLNKEMGVCDAKITELSHKASVSVPLIIRELRGVQYYAKNTWSSDAQIQELIPLMLLGKVNFNNEYDIAILDKFLPKDISCEEYWKKVLYWKKVDDSPLFFYDKTIKVVLKEELWIELKDTITSENIDLVIKYVKDYFNLLDLGNETHLNNWTGKDYLLTGLLDSCILLTIYNNESKKIDDLICSILSNNNFENQIRHFAKYFPLLAECAPQKFLEYLSNEIKDSDSPILSLFARDSNSFVGSDYCYVIWSLEYLVCLNETKYAACDALYLIYSKRFNYRMSNTPDESLYNQLIYINKRNSLSFAEKKKYILNRLDVWGSTFVDIVLDVLFKNVVIFTNGGFKWRSRNFVTETILNKDLYDLQSECIEKILSVINSSDYRFIYRIMDHFDYLTVKSAELLKQYIIKNYTENVEMYNYLTVKKYHHERFNEQNRYQNSIKVFNDVLKTIVPKDKLKASLVYFKDFSCDGYPDIEIESQDYETMYKNALVARLKLFEELKREYGIVYLLEQLVIVLPNNMLVGYFFSKVSLNDGERECLIKFLEKDRLETLSTYLVSQTDEYIKEYLIKCNEDFLVKFLGLISNGRIVPEYLFSNKKLEKEFYSHREYQETFSESEILKIKKYNPMSYLRWLSMRKLNFSEMEDVKTLLKEMPIDCISHTSDSYTVKELLSALDKSYYDNEFVEICIKYIKLFEYNTLPQCICRYLYENPSEFIRIHTQYYTDDLNHEYAFKVRMYFSFPSGFNAEKGWQFISEVMKYENVDDIWQRSLKCELGAVLARTFIVGREFSMPQLLKKWLEKINNELVNNGVIVGYINSLGSRLVTNGEPELALANKYRQDAKENEIEFPNTAKILLSIAADLVNDSKRDKEMNLVLKGIL